MHLLNHPNVSSTTASEEQVTTVQRVKTASSRD